MNVRSSRSLAAWPSLLFAPLFAALFAVAGSAQTIRDTGVVTFRIGTWNLEFLGASGNFRNNLPPRTEADHAAIGAKVRELGVAVLAVQEINDEASLRQVAAGAGPEWDLVLGQSGGWNDGKTAQRIGFVYDKSVVDLLSVEELAQLPREFEGQSIFHRVPLTAAFRHRTTGCDFRLVTVHLKAGKNATDEQKRRGEAQALATWLDALQQRPGEDQDIVLLGDFNCTYGDDPERLLEAGGRRSYVEQPAATPTIMHFPEPIDQIVVGKQCIELQRESWQVDNDHDGMAKEEWRRIYSDHYPVTVALTARHDDDPEATFTFVQGAASGAPVAVQPPQPRQRTVAKNATWPFVTGVRVSLVCGDRRLEGELLQDVPQSGSGFVLLKTERGTVAVPCTQLLQLWLL